MPERRLCLIPDWRDLSYKWADWMLFVERHVADPAS